MLFTKWEGKNSNIYDNHAVKHEEQCGEQERDDLTKKSGGEADLPSSNAVPVHQV